jgi:hypothetical protein
MSNKLDLKSDLLDKPPTPSGCHGEAVVIEPQLLKACYTGIVQTETIRHELPSKRQSLRIKREPEDRKKKSVNLFTCYYSLMVIRYN